MKKIGCSESSLRKGKVECYSVLWHKQANSRNDEEKHESEKGRNDNHFSPFSKGSAFRGHIIVTKLDDKNSMYEMERVIGAIS